MSDINPYRIRFELLQMAKDLLMEEYYAKKEAAIEYWRELKNSQGCTEFPSFPELPSYPTELDIVRKASILNDFVSRHNF